MNGHIQSPSARLKGVTSGHPYRLNCRSAVCAKLLILGFSVLCLLLAGVIGTTITKVHTVNESTDRTVNLRVPTAMTASDLVAGVYASLASLRGWLITGDDAF